MFAGALTWLLFAGGASYPLPGAHHHGIAARSCGNAADNRFIKEMIGERSVVQLGEAIRMTQEFPQARLHLLRALHETMGFDVIAFEGSMVAAWVAQEAIYRAQEDGQAVSAHALQQMAWFAAWQTDAMQEVMQYIVSTHQTAQPLYLASFDVQIGVSEAFWAHPRSELQALGQALDRFGPPPPPRLAAYLSQSNTRLVADYDAMVDDLESWLQALAPAIATSRSPAHAAALERVPASLRTMLREGDAHKTAGAVSYASYEAQRDHCSALNVQWLREHVSGSQRVIVWAHNAYIQHNSRRQRASSLGQHLLEMFPNDLYTLGFFAGHGTVWQSQQGDSLLPPYSLRQLKPLRQYGVERLLCTVCDSDYILSLEHGLNSLPQAALLQTPLASRRGSDWELSTVLAGDYHAVMFIHRVTPPQLCSLSFLREAYLRARGRLALALQLGEPDPPTPWCGLLSE